MPAHISGKCITIRGRHLRIIRKVQAALPVTNVSKLRINLHFYREHYHFYILLLKYDTAQGKYQKSSVLFIFNNNIHFTVIFSKYIYMCVFALLTGAVHHTTDV